MRSHNVFLAQFPSLCWPVCLLRMPFCMNFSFIIPSQPNVAMFQQNLVGLYESPPGPEGLLYNGSVTNLKVLARFTVNVQGCEAGNYFVLGSQSIKGDSRYISPSGPSSSSPRTHLQPARNITQMMGFLIKQRSSLGLSCE